MRPTLEAWKRDLAHAARNLLKAPGFTVITVATLALAIGANTAIFSVVDAVLLDPLAFPEPDRLISIRGTAAGTDLGEEFGLGGEFFVEYSENSRTLEDIALFQQSQTTVRAGDNVERLFVSPSSPSLFTTLRADPVVGRLPTNDDPEGEVAVLSHWLWMQWFGGDPGVVGESYEIAGGFRTVIGVMGPDFRFPDEQTAVWINDLVTEPIRPGGFGLDLVGRMAPGADHAAVVAELDALAQRLPERFGGSPTYARTIEAFQPIVRSLEEELVGDLEGPLWILLGTVAIVLLIACANVANLLLVRAEGRRRDMALRRALGAGRGGLIRSQMMEALLLAAAGGIGGALLAWAGVPLLVRAAPENIPRLSTVALDPAALLFTGGIAVVAALLSGLLPAVRFSNPQVMEGLRSSRRVGAGPDHLTRNALVVLQTAAALVVLQTAAALVLLVGSGLLLRSFRELSRVDPGYRTDDIFTFQMAPDPREHQLEDGPSFAQFHYAFMDRLAALPGVESVGLVNALPLDEGSGEVRIQTPLNASDDAAQPLLGVNFVGGDYFQTMDIRLLSGRYFERLMEPTPDPGAIVSRSAADILWPGQNPLGQQVRPAIPDPEVTFMSVVGVVEDVMLEDFRESEPRPMVYFPMVGMNPGAWAVGTPAYVVGTPRADAIATEVRELVREVAPSAPMYRVFTMAELAARSMAQLSFTMLTLGIAATLALILGAVGIYGTLSYVVSQRTREIGIRMALGARAAEVRRMVVSQGGRIAGVGVVIGIVGALSVTRVLESMLYGVRTLDLVTFVMMSAVMVGVALLASYLPARRASAVDPMRAVQAE